MKSILLSIKPQYAAKILNGEKTIEIRKNKALASAIQKLIDEKGYADIYVYCSKSNTQYLAGSKNKVCEIITKSANTRFSPSIDKYTGNGKVIFKFRCYKVEEIVLNKNHFVNEQYYTDELDYEELLEQSCLTYKELDDYLQCGIGYAIHISDLEIFDRPRELSDFIKCDNKHIRIGNCFIGFGGIPRLTKAPQNYCYIEGE